MKKKNCLHILLFSFIILQGPILVAQQTHTQDSLLVVANKDNPDSSSVKALQTIQRYFFNTGNYDSVFKYAHQLILLTKRMNDKKELAKAYFNLGTVCSNLTMYDSAKHYIELAEQEALLTSDFFYL